MNFFKSVFSDDPDPPTYKSESGSPEKAPQEEKGDTSDPNSHPKASSTPDSSMSTGGWSFGGLIKTISAKSESVIETYRRDLQEFGSGLKKEIEVAQGSLETVGHAFDEFGSSVLKGTAQIIAQGKDAILAVDQESDSDNNSNQNSSNQKGSSSKPYSRFDAQVRAIQGDTATYSEEPEDVDDYSKWKSHIVLEDKSEEIENLLEENAAVDNIYKKVVPNIVDNDTFWYRYFYRVHKLKQAEDLRANLVKRAISREEEEELSWDVDDDEDEYNEINVGSKEDVVKNKEGTDESLSKITESDDTIVDEKMKGKNEKVDEVRNLGEEANVELKDALLENKEVGGKEPDEVTKEEASVKELHAELSVSGDKEREKNSHVDNFNNGGGNGREIDGEEESDKKFYLEVGSELNNKDQILKSDEKVAIESKSDHDESPKDSDVSIVSTQPSVAEEADLEWDEIEDLSCIDERKVTQGGVTNREEMRKRLSAAEDDEDLSWDIEDDDVPAKA